MNKRSLLLLGIIALIVFTIYGPFVIKGGFSISDDLSAIHHIQSRSEDMLSLGEFEKKYLLIVSQNWKRPAWGINHI
jgi:hypothetical protein